MLDFLERVKSAVNVYFQTNMSGTVSHVSQVRALYKALLRLHRGLPYNFQAMGDQYVKDEFRRHKDCTPKEAQVFMDEWTVSIIIVNYYNNYKKL